MELTELLARSVLRLDGSDAQYDPLLELVGDASMVLLGEASHGTHEFYEMRADITRRLVDEKGFTAVVVEADWPDAFRVGSWVRHIGNDVDAEEALAGFRRFPTWMWRNREIVALLHWMRSHNAQLPLAQRVGFYGMDLYSLFTSIEAVLRYLERIDPDGARRARHRYACFDHFGEDSQAYGYATRWDGDSSCEEEVVQQLVELRRRSHDYTSRDGRVAADELFAAEQNARLISNAERYYREMFRGAVSSWNLRDSHMVETLEALAGHLERQGSAAKMVVWAHNSHLGDARATEMGNRGEHNVGQLVRQRWGPRAVLIGFTTHTGTVTAASDWDAPAERKRVRPSLPDSYERLFHEVGIDRFFLRLRGAGAVTDLLRQPRLERAIGVIYLPRSERASHYFRARLADQFDGVFHVDHTRAVEPLEPPGLWHRGEEVPETYPSGV